MESDGHHKDIISSISKELREILGGSEQGIYIYLDDINKICNEKFASLLEYDSPKEWSDIKENFPDKFVAKKSQGALVTAYQKAIENFAGSSINVVWKTKKGEEVNTNVILVPISHKEHILAIHFISKK